MSTPRVIKNENDVRGVVKMNRETNDHRDRPKSQAPARAAYRPPRLAVLGDIRSLTLGGSPGTGDSAPINTQSPSL